MKTLVLAHRGASAYAPENTLEAFRLAAEMHADGIELDVYKTADGQIAVSHDNRLGRCAKDGTGTVTEQTMDQLLKYNFNNGMDEKYPVCRIPTLGQVYDLLYDTGLIVNVEIKMQGYDFVRMIDECAKAHKMCDRVIYSSFLHYALYDMKRIDPDAFTAPLHGGELFEPWNYAKTFGAKAIHPHLGPVFGIENYVSDCHKAGIRIHPWTVDAEEDLRKMFELGVDAVITNRPDVALAIRKEIQGE
ncbi:MAG: glycerophosphodiester phosphodiesterase [Clostridia bacterium]|nr:glycerophosphodiester phosphodiesterase [Clostridia bacterium]